MEFFLLSTLFVIHLLYIARLWYKEVIMYSPKTKQINFRLNQEDFDNLVSRAKSHDMLLGAYIRTLLFNSEPPVRVGEARRR